MRSDPPFRNAWTARQACQRTHSHIYTVIERTAHFVSHFRSIYHFAGDAMQCGVHSCSILTFSQPEVTKRERTWSTWRGTSCSERNPLISLVYVVCLRSFRIYVYIDTTTCCAHIAHALALHNGMQYEVGAVTTVGRMKGFAHSHGSISTYLLNYALLVKLTIYIVHIFQQKPKKC